MEKNSSLQANISSASQEIPRILWNAKAHYLSISFIQCRVTVIRTNIST